MLGAGGLKAAAKRTAFGDLSNVVKNVNVKDDSAVTGKHNMIDKPAVCLEKSAPLLRPAQRPLTVSGLKGLLGHSSHSHAPITNSTFTKPSVTEAQQQPIAHLAKTRNAPAKRVTAVYNDPTPSVDAAGPCNMPPPMAESFPVAPVHQNLGPRQHRSQPYLRADQPVLRRTQSKHVSVYPEAQAAPGLVQPVQHEQKREQPEVVVEDSNLVYDSYLKLIASDQEYVSAKETHALPTVPLVSEPEEYWEEEEDDEIYDEQGYTTAHSYRSRGDNTTGGATTVLFPKVNTKVKQELAAAKELVESARTAEDIEDEAWDTSMVAEYGDEIFAYMRELEVSLGMSTNKATSAAQSGSRRAWPCFVVRRQA